MIDFKFKNLAALCRAFSMTPSGLAFLRKNKKDLIRPIHITKKTGGYRVVYMVANDQYRNFLRLLAHEISKRYKPSSAVQGFVKDRSAYTNAKKHTWKKEVLNLDIKDFFPSIGRDKVTRMLVDLGFQGGHALILCDLLTVDGALAMGFPTSPVLSNMVCGDLDADLMDLAAAHSCRYTRYVDDITFSGDSTPPKEEVASRIAPYGFRLNFKKYKLQRRGGAQYVTGFTVCNKKPRIPRRTKRNLRLEVYYIKKYGYASHLVYHTKKLSEKGVLPKTFFLFKGLPSHYLYPGWTGYLAVAEPGFSHEIKSSLEASEMITAEDRLLDRSKFSKK